MRSLSLESIPVNNNMKVLILLVALFVQTNPSLSMPTPADLKPIFTEVLYSLHDLEHQLKHHNLKEIKQTVQIQTPHDIKNPCECVAPFVRHLKDALQSVKDALHKDKIHIDEIDNILDNINTLHLHKNPHVNCNFTKHTLRHEELSKDWIQSYIRFIQNWNTRESHNPTSC